MSYYRDDSYDNWEHGGTLRVHAGYRAFNGHVFTDAEARAYNQACDQYEAGLTTANQRHAAFLICIGEKP